MYIHFLHRLLQRFRSILWKNIEKNDTVLTHGKSAGASTNREAPADIRNSPGRQIARMWAKMPKGSILQFAQKQKNNPQY